MTTTFLEELKRLKAAATECKGNNQSELTASELIDAWREEDKLADFLVNHADTIAELVRAVQEVIRISDRKHDAWDAAKAALDKLNGGKS